MPLGGFVANIGFGPESLLLGLAMVLGILAVAAIGAAGVGVAVFGPREADSLIIPAMAVLGVLVVVVFAMPSVTSQLWLLILIALVTGLGAAALQRFALDRLPADSTAWPAIYLVGGIVAGTGVGIVGGLLTGAGSGGPGSVAATAVVGAVVGGLIGWRGGRPRPMPDDVESEPPPPG